LDWTFWKPDGYSTLKQKIENIPPGSSDRQWWYQTCSELAYFQNAPKHGSIRSSYVNMTYHKNHCYAVFGEGIWPDVDATNAYYGGANISATNIFFANGSQDPWQRASVTKTLGKLEPAMLIECGSNCCHCVDYRGCPSPGCEKPDILNGARKMIEEHVGRWLKE